MGNWKWKHCEHVVFYLMRYNLRVRPKARKISWVPQCQNMVNMSRLMIRFVIINAMYDYMTT